MSKTTTAKKKKAAPSTDNSTKVSGPSWDEVVKKKASHLAFDPEIREIEKIKCVELISTLIKKTDNNKIVWEQRYARSFSLQLTPKSRFLLDGSRLVLENRGTKQAIDETISLSLINDLYMAASHQQDSKGVPMDWWLWAVEEI